MSNIRILMLAAVALTVTSVASAQADVVIATAGPMSGPYAWNGEEHVYSTQMTGGQIEIRTSAL